LLDPCVISRAARWSRAWIQSHEIATLLSQLDHEGHTLSAGVTPLRDGTSD